MIPRSLRRARISFILTLYYTRHTKLHIIAFHGLPFSLFERAKSTYSIFIPYYRSRMSAPTIRSSLVAERGYSAEG